MQSWSTGKYLTCSKLTRSELEQLFSTLVAQNSITDITIESSDLSFLSEDILVKSFSRLRYLELSSTNLTTPQLSALFSMLKDSTELEELVLVRSILSNVSAQDLATTLTRLRKAKLEYSYLTTKQCSIIFKEGKQCNDDTMYLSSLLVHIVTDL